MKFIKNRGDGGGRVGEMDEGDYYCRARDCEIYKEANLAEIQDLREDEIFWPCDRVPIPKIDFVDFVFTHISECIELDQLPEADEKFLTNIGDKINEYLQSKYFYMNFWPSDSVPIPKINLVDFVFSHILKYIKLEEIPEADEKFLINVEDEINEYTQSKYSHMKENRNKVFKVVTVSGKKELVRIESRITV